jgi:hypothetical protein
MGIYGAFLRRKISQGLKLKNHTQISEQNKNAWIYTSTLPYFFMNGALLSTGRTWLLQESKYFNLNLMENCRTIFPKTQLF